MEHLLDRQNGNVVPMWYRCQTMYDGGDFDTYPDRSGWDWEALKRDDFQDNSENGATGFLQSWLYFGLLWDYFGHQKGFDLSQFIRQTKEGTTVSTQHLPEYIRLWAQDEATKSDEERNKAFEYTLYRLRFVYKIASEFCRGFPVNSRTDYKRSKWQLPDDTGLSIQILCDTLQHAGWKIYRKRYSMEWGYSPLLERKMKQDGWCPRAIVTCTHGQQIQVLCYASTLGPPPVSKVHQKCTEFSCSWEQIDNSTYKTLHKPPCTNCEFIGPEQDDLACIYERNETPLFRLDVKSLRYQVVGTMESGAYTALSHVWADGLGNRQKNALPICQLKSVQNMVDQLQEKKLPYPVFWWCDTLCIPVGKQNEKYRRKSIENMHATYSNAAKTLILDGELMHASVHDPPVELYIRLKLSSWARRLWTLQESNLSLNAFIQLSDGVMPLRDLYSAIHQDGQCNNRSLYTRYTMVADALFPPLLYSEAKEALPQPNLISIWRQLEWRGTSRQTDETVGLTKLMRGNPSKILEINENDCDGRMAKFFELIKVVPLMLVFQPPPRLARHGFRWAPASFLACFRNENPLNSSRVVHEVGIVHEINKAKRQYGLLLQKNRVILFKSEPRNCLRWQDKTFVFTVKEGGLLQGAYRVIYAFKKDWEAAHGTGNTRVDRPVLFILLPAARDGIYACILAEEKPAEDSSTGDYRTADFVAIVTIETVAAKAQKDLLVANEVPPEPWILR